MELFGLTFTSIGVWTAFWVVFWPEILDGTNILCFHRATYYYKMEGWRGALKVAAAVVVASAAVPWLGIWITEQISEVVPEAYMLAGGCALFIILGYVAVPKKEKEPEYWWEHTIHFLSWPFRQWEELVEGMQGWLSLRGAFMSVLIVYFLQEIFDKTGFATAGLQMSGMVADDNGAGSFLALIAVNLPTVALVIIIGAIGARAAKRFGWVRVLGDYVPYIGVLGFFGGAMYLGYKAYLVWPA
jgi:putative Ca2+/H+ antiporter (TMEM165/GDT1 family)